MKRLVFTCIGLTLLATANGCCCMRSCGFSPCSPCASPCAAPCAAPCGAPATYGVPPGAALTPYGTQAAMLPQGTVNGGTAYIGQPTVTTAMLPMESLPTY